MEKRIEKAIDIFLDAINNGTLAKGNCARCAVGNLCGGDGAWGNLFFTDDGEQTDFRNNLNVHNRIQAIQAIAKTDFSIEELMKIEYAFETNTVLHISKYYIHSSEKIRQDQINGLKAVVKVMLSFSNDSTTNIDEVFTNKANLIPITA